MQWKEWDLQPNEQVALEDSEPWVSMLADLMGTFPSTGQLNTEVSTPDSNRWKYFLACFDSFWYNELSGKYTAIYWLSSERLWRSMVTRTTRCCRWNATSWTRTPSYLSLVTNHNQANTSLWRGNPKLPLSKLIWWLGNHFPVNSDWWKSARSVEAATKVKSQPASFPQRIRTMPKKLSDMTPLKVRWGSVPELTRHRWWDDNYKQIVKGIRAGPAGLGRSFSNSGQRVSLPNR